MDTFSLHFEHVDVFARHPLSGNGLSVFFLEQELSASLMLRLTQEMRQFESIFLSPTAEPTRFCARIFTMEEELGFAGHPIIGAAAALHARHFQNASEVHLHLMTPEKGIPVVSRRVDSVYSAEMDQGEASYLGTVDPGRYDEILAALNLSHPDLAEPLPLEVVSTGLPYLIVPIKTNLDRAAIQIPNFESLLADIGAKFVYVLDVNEFEGRTWDNDGRVEDIATGSAAGPAAAYLVHHGLAAEDSAIRINQGRFVDRPSEMLVTVRTGAKPGISVSGQVCFVGKGVLELPTLFYQRMS
ncbi:MAG: PhzF family phenazine biosynthesis protein [Acidobacteria bacterium]|nr:PhzF family phenazine biosynthesis protein [Acidobacteriota bacterium]